MSGRSHASGPIESVSVQRMPKPRLAGERLPLASLRSRLDEASSSAYWAMNADGVLGRSLMMSVGATVTFPLALAGEVRFEARAMLLPHDWRDGRDAVRAIVTVTDTTGHAHQLWSGMLRASDRGRPRGRRADCRIPAGSTSLQLGLEAPGALRPRSVARAIWLEPTITDPAAPPITRPGDSTRPAPPPPTNTPLISVLTPVHDPPVHMLEEAIASVRAQTFTNWELCLADDGSTDPEIIAALERHAASDPRIHLTRRDTAGGISAATNTALETATGEYIALLDHDDTLAPDALQHVADRIAAQPDLDMIYTDEDIVLDGQQIWIHLKPDGHPTRCAPTATRAISGSTDARCVSEIGGFRTEFNGSQDVDMILRLVERTDRIAHIPRILYHWRAHADSTAGGDAKPYAYVAARNAIAAHLERSGIEADVGYGPPGLYRVAHRVDPVDDSRSGARRRPPDRARASRRLLARAAPPRLAGRACRAPRHPRRRRHRAHHRRRPRHPHHHHLHHSRPAARRRAHRRRPGRHRRTPAAHADPRHRPHPRLAHPTARLQPPTRHRRRRPHHARPRRTHRARRRRHPRTASPSTSSMGPDRRWTTSSDTGRRCTT